jgi:pilus assembly protein Flp/PilA
MLFGKKVFNEEGQGLVEYALILVLVAIVVIAILRILGPVVGEVFSEVTLALGYDNSGVITTVEANRNGAGSASAIRVTITVSTPTRVSITESPAGRTGEIASCSGSCNIVLDPVDDAGGTVTVTADEGGIVRTSYPAR